MIFNSINFILFFILIIILYFALPYKYRNLLLLIGSFVFFASAKPKYIVILLFAIVTSYFTGIIIDKVKEKKHRRIILFCGIFIILGQLLFFKYWNFFSSTSNIFFNKFNLQFKIPSIRWAAPLGISFYTLQILGYIIDVYKDKVKAEKNFIDFALFASFFPTISSGPIERADNLLVQLHNKYDFDYERISDALKLILWGLFKKMVIADRLSTYVNMVYNDVQNYTGLPLIFATLLFGIQLYCDFSGYTDMAIGFGKILGYKLINNFNVPYFSKDVQEFWRRWHISLSTWFRDYLYIPLGGSRVKKIRIYFNIFVVFLASGLWHGANYTFIAWGCIHGFYLMIERALKNSRSKFIKVFNINEKSKFYNAVRIIKTYLLINFAWIFFRANSLKDALYIVKNMFNNISWNQFTIYFNSIFINDTIEKTYFNDNLKITIILMFILFIVDFIQYRKGSIFKLLKNKSILIRWGFYYVLVFSIIFFGVYISKQFIYMQF